MISPSRENRLVVLTMALLISGTTVVPSVQASSQTTLLQIQFSDQIQQLANRIGALPTIQGTSCQDVLTVIENGNLTISQMNQVLGTNFDPVSVDKNSCSMILEFLPMVGPYNDLVTAGRQYNPSNPASVTNFYIKAFVFTGELGVMNDKVAYKIAFRSTGELNDALKLGKLRSICGSECYVAVLSAIHWFIRDNANQFLGDFESWAQQYLQSNTKNVPEFPDQILILSLFTALIVVAYVLVRRSGFAN